jgi:hypothetical protein
VRARDKQPTYTSLAEEAMRLWDDFVSLEDLKELTGFDTSHASACLYHLKKFGAADCVEGPDGKLWWFLTGTDRRSFVVEEKARADKPRRPRKTRAKPPAG